MRAENIHIRGGHLIDPKNGIDRQADVFVTEGKISAIGEKPADFAATRVIDAADHIVCPGLVDLAARLPSLDSELAAAVAGGITALACPPDTEPPLDEPGLVERLVRHSEAIGLARVFPIGALTRQLAGEKLSEMVGLANAGCIAFSQATRPIFDTQILLRAMQYAATFGYAVRLQPQDHYLAKNGVAHDGRVASRLGLPGIPTCAETVAISTALHLAAETGVRLHLSKLTTAAGVAMVRRAKHDGVKVSCDVAIHHLHLSEDDIGYFDSLACFDPPLRTAADRASLRTAAAEGLAMICSDHTPVGEDGKQLPFGEALPGAIGLELLLPLVLRWAREDKLALPTALARVTCDPASALGIDAGSLEAGQRADICIFDPREPWRIQAETLHSREKNTPFLGREILGRV
ncbi:MAG: dihydroorotase, partial [Candidatus Accumulibacter sp.]|nr:dihydroorotase [Accumulibacter sp.]